jgi:hypothetical protein
LFEERVLRRIFGLMREEGTESYRNNKLFAPKFVVFNKHY